MTENEMAAAVDRPGGATAAMRTDPGRRPTRAAARAERRFVTIDTALAQRSKTAATTADVRRSVIGAQGVLQAGAPPMVVVADAAGASG